MTVALVAVPAAVAVIPPGDEVTVYPLIWDPPLEAGAVQVTVAWALPAGARPPGGGPRGPPGGAPPVGGGAGAPPPGVGAGAGGGGGGGRGRGAARGRVAV